MDYGFDALDNSYGFSYITLHCLFIFFINKKTRKYNSVDSYQG